jgi:hypothetical protein
MPIFVKVLHDNVCRAAKGTPPQNEVPFGNLNLQIVDVQGTARLSRLHVDRHY